jgi:hypothetical protein
LSTRREIWQLASDGIAFEELTFTQCKHAKEIRISTCQDPGLERQHSLTWLDAGRHIPHCGLHYDSCCSTSLGSNATYQILEEISSLNSLFSSGQTFRTRIQPLKCVVAIFTNIPSYVVVLLAQTNCSAVCCKLHFARKDTAAVSKLSLFA